MPNASTDSILQSTANNEVDSGQGINLADLILEKIAAHEVLQTDRSEVQGETLPDEPVELPAKVVEVYSK